MKTLIVTATAAAAALALAMPLASSAQQAPDGAALFDGRCKFCHDAGAGPGRDILSKMTPAHIVEALTTGPMQPMAAGMSDADKQAIATFLTASASGATPAAPATPETPAAPATNAPATSAIPAAPSTPAAPATNAPTTP